MSIDSPTMDGRAPVYRVYLRHPKQMVSHKTVTSSPDVAVAVFRELLRRSDLNGQTIGAVLSLNGRQLAYHRFDHKPGMDNYWDAEGEIPLSYQQRQGSA